MKITKSQLKRIIKEEKLKILRENYGSDSDELNSLGAMMYRFAEDLDGNEAYYRLERGDIDIPGLEGQIAEVIMKLRDIDSQIRSARGNLK